MSNIAPYLRRLRFRRKLKHFLPPPQKMAVYQKLRWRFCHSRRRHRLLLFHHLFQKLTIFPASMTFPLSVQGILQTAPPRSLTSQEAQL